MPLLLALLPLLLTPPAVPEGPLTPEAVVSLVGRLPAFAPSAGRTQLEVVRLVAIPNSRERVYWVELGWTEGGRTRTALAVVGRTDPDPEADGRSSPFEWLARRDPWGVARLDEDKTWDDLVASLRRARMSAFESATVGDLRAIVSAEMAFAAEAKGAYGELRCLASPTQCLPDSKDGALAAEAVAESERFGYRRTFHAGSRRPWSGTGPSPLLESFAVTAVPLEVGETGQRSFCADSKGTFCERQDGAEPLTRGGLCDEPCQCLGCEAAPQQQPARP